jgi:hypothetical protein
MNKFDIYSIALAEPNEDIAERIEDAYPVPFHYKMSDSFWLICCDKDARNILIESINDSGVAEEIAETIGLLGNPENDTVGLVAKLESAYAGWAFADMWKWIEMVKPGKVKYFHDNT